MITPKRSTISDYTESVLKAEIINKCPVCGKFEGTSDKFTNHHINHDPSISAYWNLIRVCKKCHEDINKHKDDAKRDRKIKQIKTDLFRNYIGPASLEVLLLAYKHGITSSPPSLANSLIRFELVNISKANIFSAGAHKHFTLSDYSITPKGKELVDKLSLSYLLL